MLRGNALPVSPAGPANKHELHLYLERECVFQFPDRHKKKVANTRGQDACASEKHCPQQELSLEPAIPEVRAHGGGTW